MQKRDPLFFPTPPPEAAQEKRNLKSEKNPLNYAYKVWKESNHDS
jgi:hypothetical protein